MKIFKTVPLIQQYLKSDKSLNIGYVPTMGGLHEGHLSLLKIAKRLSDICVSSIYVNPSQFNEKEDFEKYPRVFEKDVEKLIKTGNDVLFYPTDEEVYPENLDTSIDIDMGILGDIMEGKYRPGHFEGMLEVVHRLINIIHPDYLIMGQKDIQQAKLVDKMIAQLNLDVKLVVGPTTREIDGLAMSSRNRRLKPETRDKATIIYQTLCWAADAIHEQNIKSIETKAMEMLTNEDFQPEYFQIVDAETLHPVDQLIENMNLMACTAVWAGEIRLIDNMFLQKKL